MAQAQLKQAVTEFDRFYHSAAPYLSIRDDEHYQESLSLVESLLEEVAEDADHPKNILIEMLIHAIQDYEGEIPEIQAFDKAVSENMNDAAILRLLMDQHGLTGSDFPEIGDKSYVSRIVNEKRQLTRGHIEKLSKRFQLNPSLFFS